MRQTYRVVVETKAREEIRRFEILSLKKAEKIAEREEQKIGENEQVTIEKEVIYYDE
jgi:hypothetical protein